MFILTKNMQPSFLLPGCRVVPSNRFLPDISRKVANFYTLLNQNAF